MPTDEEILFPRAGAAHYALIDIGPGTITGINGKGQCVGYVEPAAGSTAEFTSFFWDKGTRKTLAGRKPLAYGINDAGAIVGAAEFAVPRTTPPQYNYRAAYWASAESQPVDLGSLGGRDGNKDGEVNAAEWGTSTAGAINNAGMIVGGSSHAVQTEFDSGHYESGQSTKAVRFNVGGKPTLLGPGKADDFKISNSIYVLSEGGVAVGMTSDPEGYTGAALWDNGQFSQDLGADFYPSSITTAPASDHRYKYYVVGTQVIPPPAPSDDPPPPPDTGARLLLKPKNGGAFLTKTLPTATPIGITTDGLATTGDKHQWRNGQDVNMEADISVADGSTLDAISTHTARG